MIGREDLYDHGPKARSRGFRQQIREDVNIVCFINARWSSCQTEFDSQEVGCQNLLSSAFSLRHSVPSLSSAFHASSFAKLECLGAPLRV